MFRMAMKSVVTLSSVPKLTIPFTYIAWQKGYIHPFPLTVGTLSPLNFIFMLIRFSSSLHTRSTLKTKALNVTFYTPASKANRCSVGRTNLQLMFHKEM